MAFHKCYLLILVLGFSTVSGMSPSLFSKSPQPNFNGKEKKKAPKKNPLLNKPYAELKEGKRKALIAKDLPQVIKHLDAMITLCDDNHEEKQKLLIELADTYCDRQEWTKAEKYYDEFILFNPGAARCDYAHYKSIVSAYKQTLDPERDQTKTQDALRKTEQFLTLYAASDYKADVQKIAQQCYFKLLESEKYIINFHCHRKSFKAAQKRLERIATELIPHIPEQKPHYLELSIQVAQAQNNRPHVLKTQLELAQHFPEHEITKRLAPDVPTITLELAAREPATPQPLAPTTLARADTAIMSGTDSLNKKLVKERELNASTHPLVPTVAQEELNSYAKKREDEKELLLQQDTKLQIANQSLPSPSSPPKKRTA